MVSTSGCAMADEVDLVGYLSPVIRVGDEEDNIVELVEWPRLKGSRVEYPTGSSRFREFCKAKSSIDGIWGHAFGYRATDGAYFSSSSSRPCFFDLSSAGRVWNDNLLWVSVDLYLTLPTFYARISCKVSRKESFIDVVAREGTELEAVLKELEISRFKRVTSKDDKVRRSQAKRRMAGKTPGSMEEKLLTPELNTPLKLARLNKMPDGPVDMATISNTVVRNLAKRKAESNKIGDRADLRPRFEVEAGLLEEQCRAKAREMMVTIVDDEFKKRFWHLAKEIMDEEEVEEIEDGLNVVEKTAADNQETIDQEIESSRLRVVDLEGLLEVEKKSSVELQLDDNVKLSLKLEEAKSQVEDMTATILSRDLALNQLTNDLAELKEKATLDRLKADLHHLKGREAQSWAYLAKVQAKNKSLEDDLAYARRNVRRSVQRDKEMNERIYQLCARISKLELELRVRELKYEKDLKFELDKRDGEISSGEESREMKEFLCRKEDLVENMRIVLTNSWQKSIDFTRQMSERIDQLIAELAESKAPRLRDNKSVVVTHQSFKELVVHEQEKCDGESLYQRKLSALVVFFVEEIKFLQVERDLMQDCFSGRTCVNKLDISSIDPIGVMDRGIGTTTAE
ncbi:hypothetical protein GIB67_020352 [Kingdonia uniflora]|uniref:Uncharacterized protein n=1 Tax=Kingdonia uniflora TaxID=39325 RepID=A0A7J7LR81_9MAGN|nr:hypothetical protein GIB67_020352 [Kingdonia uniflora]